MARRRTLGAIAVLFGTAPLLHAEETPQGDRVIILASGIQTYIYERGGKVGGPLYDRLRCTFDRAGIPFDIQFMPLTRVVRHFTDAKVAAVVPAVKGTRFSEFADWLGPFTTSQSFWFYRKHGPRSYGAFDLKRDGIVGTKKESAWRLYLEDHGYRIGSFAETVEDGMAQLLSGKVDAILGSDTHRAPGAIPSKLLENVVPIPAFETQFGGYFRHSFLEAEDGRRRRIVTALEGCATRE